jgi:hypothetical protein
MLPIMLMEKLRRGLRPSAAGACGFRVVAHRPLVRAISLVGVALVVVAAAAFGYWLGMARSELDRDYLLALEIRERVQRDRIESLDGELANSRLAQTVDAQAASSLRDTISDLHDRVAGLREEVTFYKSLMAPSSIERGLQIAEFDLRRGELDNQFTYHLLLTQAEQQRSWLQGDVRLEVQGVRADTSGQSVEEVLPLTELGDVDDYPLPFRFRYFQDLSGTVTLPDGFRPRTVRVLATPKGTSAERQERSFDWIVQSG